MSRFAALVLLCLAVAVSATGTASANPPTTKAFMAGVWAKAVTVWTARAHARGYGITCDPFNVIMGEKCTITGTRNPGVRIGIATYPYPDPCTYQGGILGFPTSRSATKFTVNVCQPGWQSALPNPW